MIPNVLLSSGNDKYTHSWDTNMKKLIFAIALALSGCSTLMSYNVATFDGGEYDQITNIRVDAMLDQFMCSDPVQMKALVKDLNKEGIKLVIYSQGIPNNADTVKLESDLNHIIGELNQRYGTDGPISPAYCKDKLQIIERSATDIQKVIGYKPH